jgi:hypothetical protein
MTILSLKFPTLLTLKARLEQAAAFLYRHRDRVRGFLLGTRSHYGLIFTVVVYALLVAIGFVYLYPLLFMLVTSLKSPTDLLNPMVQWVPTELYFGNYVRAFRVLDYPRTLLNSVIVSTVPSVIQVIVCSIVAYGLARYSFPGKRLLFVLILATFIIPPQNTVIPQMLTYRRLGLLGRIWSLVLPALGGQDLPRPPQSPGRSGPPGRRLRPAGIPPDRRPRRPPSLHRLHHLLHRLVLERDLPDGHLPGGRHPDPADATFQVRAGLPESLPARHGQHL